MTEYIDTEGACLALKQSSRTVTQMAKSGALRASKRNGRWYYDPEDIADYIEAGMNREKPRRRRRRAS